MHAVHSTYCLCGASVHTSILCATRAADTLDELRVARMHNIVNPPNPGPEITLRELSIVHSDNADENILDDMPPFTTGHLAAAELDSFTLHESEFINNVLQTQLASLSSLRLRYLNTYGTNLDIIAVISLNLILRTHRD